MEYLVSLTATAFLEGKVYVEADSKEEAIAKAKEVELSGKLGWNCSSLEVDSATIEDPDSNG